MFNKKDFINWNNQAIRTETQDWCSFVNNPMKQLKDAPGQNNINIEINEDNFEEGVKDVLGNAAGAGVAAGGAALYGMGKLRKLYKNLRNRSANISANFYNHDPERGWDGWEARKKASRQANQQGEPDKKN
tara:strand:+ start:120 stop:512 length:393 start_codon:yes stop_codon:yes gene_type:complete